MKIDVPKNHLFINLILIKMKSIFSIIITLFVSFSAIGANNLTLKGGETTATFKGFTEDGEFKFIDENKAVLLFSTISEEITIDLSDDEYTNKKFIITWEDATSDVYDDEGEPTGKTVAIKNITKLKVVK